MDESWSSKFTSAQRERWLAAIAKRYSCRQYAGAPSLEARSALQYTLARMPVGGARIALGEGDPQALYFGLPFVPAISGSGHFAAVLIQQDAPDAQLMAGVIGEALVLEATHLGLGTCWVAGNVRRGALGLSPKKNERIAAVIALGQPAGANSLLHDRRKPLARLCLSDPSAWPLWAYQAAEAVRWAPSALNRQPWRMGFSGNTLMLTSGRYGCLDDGIALLHAECGLRGTPHRWRQAADGRSMLVASGENDDVPA